MAYFDNAATTYPKPEQVYSFMDQFYRENGFSAGRGQYSQGITSGQLIDDTRRRIKELLHCPLKKVIFTPTATIALNMIIQGLIKTGLENIYISPFEHNAVTRSLYNYEKTGQIKVKQLAVSKELVYDLERIKYQFEESKPDLIIVSHASNVIGLIAPILEIFEIAKEYNSVTLTDMAQTAGLVDIDVGSDLIDFAVFAGHKTLYGPTGISGFIMKDGFNLPSILFGGTGYDSANQDMPGTIPEKYEMGTMNIQAISGLNAALKWIQTQGINTIFEIERKNREKLIKLLLNYDFIKLIGCYSNNNYIGVVSFIIDGISSDSAVSLFNNYGICVRTGLHCAPLSHQFLGTFPTGTVRVSVSYFTNEEDYLELEELLNVISEEL